MAVAPAHLARVGLGLHVAERGGRPLVQFVAMARLLAQQREQRLAHNAPSGPVARRVGQFGGRKYWTVNAGSAAICASVYRSVIHCPDAYRRGWSVLNGERGLADCEYTSRLQERGPAGRSSTAIRKLVPNDTSG